MEQINGSKKTKVVVATTAMLSFISFWRAAAIVLNDLGSSAFYVGGIAEQAIGRAAPWFIFGVMLFSFAVRAVYIESCAMFTRGGVYRVVKRAMGGTLARLSVSALIFDFLLTGPISGVSAGQYIISLIAQTMTYFNYPWHPSKATVNKLAACIALIVVIYFWWRNIKGIHESSSDALNIMKIATVMVVIIILWGGLTLLTRGPSQMPPLPLPHNLTFNDDALGWLPAITPSVFQNVSFEAARGYSPPADEPHHEFFGFTPDIGLLIGLIGILVALGHSVLAMSGEETLAQVNRELEHPKHKNLMRAGFIIFMYSLLFTSLVSFLAAMLIPNAERPHYFDNLISGVVMHLNGPLLLRLLFQAFVVTVGFLMLSGAVNTAIIGSNGVLNRVSEDGVLTGWFRKPHKRYGTTYRMINLIVLLQIFTIIASRGEVYVLGEAYAFGVIWSFALNGLAMLVLRFKDKTKREWRVPFNLKIKNIELPLGLGAVAFLLFAIAVVNIITKQVATVSGLAFTFVLFGVFTVSEHINKRKQDIAKQGLEQFNLALEEEINLDSVQIRPGCVLVPVRNYNKLSMLEYALASTNTDDTDVIALTIRIVTSPLDSTSGLHDEKIFSEYEQKLFTQVVTIAEHFGKHVHLLIVPSNNIYDALAQTATRLDASQIVVGVSSKMEAQDQALRIGHAWEKLPKRTRRQVTFTVVVSPSEVYSVYLGAHAPQLTEDDINKIHSVWLKITKERGLRHVHHRDVVRVAVDRLDLDLYRDTTIIKQFTLIESQSADSDKLL